MSLLPLLLLTLACADNGGDAGTSEGLPPAGAQDDSGSSDVGSSDVGSSDVGSTDTGFVPGDGAGGPEEGDDSAPAHTLTLVQAGEWSMSPFAGPYETVAGELRVTEYLDGGPPDDEGRGGGALQCTATFALTGFAADTACADCAVAFTVHHQLTEDGAVVGGAEVGGAEVGGGGDTGAPEEIPGLAGCMAPDLPTDGEEIVLGLSSDGRTISKQTGAEGWVPWYEAETRFEDVDFSWTATVGVELEEEEEE